MALLLRVLCCRCSSSSSLLLCMLLLRNTELGGHLLTYRMASPASIALLDIAGAVSQLADGGGVHPCCSPGLILTSCHPDIPGTAGQPSHMGKNCPLPKEFIGINLPSFSAQAAWVPVLPWGKGNMLQADQLEQVVKPWPRTSPG